jgi:acyl-CoA thioesterase-1
MVLGGRLFNAILLVGFMLAAPMAALADPGKPIRIVAFGDSLTAGYMLPPRDAFPAQLQAALKARGHAVEVINAGVSGDTTAGGLERFDWAVPEGAEAVILELGANDALRGIDPALARANLRKILDRLKSRRIEVLIAGMAAPRNWGDAYVSSFEGMFAELAAEAQAIHYPFFLEGVAMRPELNLGDGLHPNAKGVATIVRNILPTVERLIEQVKAARAVAAKG